MTCVLGACWLGVSLASGTASAQATVSPVDAVLLARSPSVGPEGRKPTVPTAPVERLVEPLTFRDLAYTWVWSTGVRALLSIATFQASYALANRTWGATGDVQVASVVFTGLMAPIVCAASVGVASGLFEVRGHRSDWLRAFLFSSGLSIVATWLVGALALSTSQVSVITAATMLVGAADLALVAWSPREPAGDTR